MSSHETEAIATGKLCYEQIEGKTNVTYSYATYPLKFIHPRGPIRCNHDAVLTYMLGYGGGIVSGDFVRIECNIQEKCSVVLCTQATTKVFRSRSLAALHKSEQNVHATIGPHAILAFIPDPIACFQGARFQQKQTFIMSSTSSLIFVDWLISGRKRSFLSTGQVLSNREEQYEQWAFESYDTKTEIYVDDEPLLVDRARLADDEMIPLKTQMARTHIIGVLIVFGPRFSCMTESLLQQHSRKQVSYSSHRLSTECASHTLPEVLTSASPLGNRGVLVRFQGSDTESTMRYIREQLGDLEHIVGFLPYQEGR